MESVEKQIGNGTCCNQRSGLAAPRSRIYLQIESQIGKKTYKKLLNNIFNDRAVTLHRSIMTDIYNNALLK